MLRIQQNIIKIYNYTKNHKQIINFIHDKTSNGSNSNAIPDGDSEFKVIDFL